MEVTRTWLRNQVEQGDPTDTGEWFTLDLDALREQRFQYLEIHLSDQDGDPRPDDVRLLKEDQGRGCSPSPEGEGDPLDRSPDQGFYLSLSGLEAAVDAARDQIYRPWNEMAVAVHAALTAAGAQIPSLDTLLTWTEGRKWFR